MEDESSVGAKRIFKAGEAVLVETVAGAGEFAEHLSGAWGIALFELKSALT